MNRSLDHGTEYRIVKSQILQHPWSRAIYQRSFETTIAYTSSTGCHNLEVGANTNVGTSHSDTPYEGRTYREVCLICLLAPLRMCCTVVVLKAGQSPTCKLRSSPRIISAMVTTAGISSGNGGVVAL